MFFKSMIISAVAIFSMLGCVRHSGNPEELINARLQISQLQAEVADLKLQKSLATTSWNDCEDGLDLYRTQAYDCEETSLDQADELYACRIKLDPKLKPSAPQRVLKKMNRSLASN